MSVAVVVVMVSVVVVVACSCCTPRLSLLTSIRSPCPTLPHSHLSPHGIACTRLSALLRSPSPIPLVPRFAFL